MNNIFLKINLFFDASINLDSRLFRKTELRFKKKAMEEAKGRLKDYKNVGKDPEECRRRRQEMTVQLRKVSPNRISNNSFHFTFYMAITKFFVRIAKIKVYNFFMRMG